MYVLIHDIVPYGRNARVHSDSDLSALAESIREFGLRGRIQLVSPENPVLVNGHGRVEACRRLGWTEIPDSNIEFVGDLTDEQVRAYRIADNKTAEGSRWNISLLKSEVKGLKTVDMARPEGMVGFNYAKTMPEKRKAGQACHFFIDDYQFERVWSRPAEYLEPLRGFSCVLTLDFSLYMDMPAPMQAWNRYRSQALGLFWEHRMARRLPVRPGHGRDHGGGRRRRPQRLGRPHGEARGLLPAPGARGARHARRAGRGLDVP